MQNKPYQPPVLLPPSRPMTSIRHVFLALSYIYFVISPASFCLYCHMFTLSTEKPQPRVDSGLVLKSGLEFWYIFNGWPAPQVERSPIRDMPCPVSLGGNVTQVLQSLSESDMRWGVCGWGLDINTVQSSQGMLMSSQHWEWLHQLLSCSKARRRNWQGVRVFYITRCFGGPASAGFHFFSG